MELLETNPQPAPTSVTQDAPPILTGIKDPLAGAAEQYQYVLTLPLVGMFIGPVGCPETIEGREEPDADAYKGGDPVGKAPRIIIQC